MSFVGKTRSEVALFGIASMLLLALGIPLITHASTDSDDEDAVITTVAGPTLEDIGLPGENLRPTGLALDRETGDVYIASGQEHRVLMRDADTGILSLVAGTGEAGFAGDDGPAVSAKLTFPRALAFTRGMLFVADRNNNRVRVVNTTDEEISITTADDSDLEVVTIEPGHIATIAGNGQDLWNGGNGSKAALSAAIRPNGLAIDDEGNLFIAHARSDRTLFMNLQQEPVPLPGQRDRLLDPGQVASVVGDGVSTYAGDGGPAHLASLDLVPNVDLPPDGEHLLFLADRNLPRVRVANLTGETVEVAGVEIEAGNIDTVAGNGARTNDPDEPGFDENLLEVLLGDGGPATTASLVGPTDVSVDDDGNIFITSSQDQLGVAGAQPRIRRVDAKKGIITTIAGNGVVTGSIDGEGGDPSDDFGDDGPPTKATFSGRNFNILLDNQDRVLISDNFAQRVRRIDDDDDDDD